MIDQVGYLISSHINYTKPLVNLIKSMRNIPPENIMAVIGGCNHWSYDSKLGFRAIRTNHNSFDYTALIELIETNFEFPQHIFLLQDTMKLSPTTDSLIKKANPDMLGTAVWGGQCNLVLYRKDYLFDNRYYILGLKNLSKKEAIQEEGVLYRKIIEPLRGSYEGELHILGQEKVYDGSERIVEFYSSIELYKYKANFDGLDPKIGRFITEP